MGIVLYRTLLTELYVVRLTRIDHIAVACTPTQHNRTGILHHRSHGHENLKRVLLHIPCSGDKPLTMGTELSPAAGGLRDAYVTGRDLGDVLGWKDT